MSTTIDTLQIEIQSSASSAAASIDKIADALGRIKKSTITSAAIKNLNSLTAALKGLTPVSSSANKLASLADSLEKLKNTKFSNTIGKNLTALAESLRSVQSVNLTGLDSQIQKVATALTPLGQIKSGGVGSMVTGLSKIKQVVDDLDETTIGEFATKVEDLTKKVAPLSEKMTPIATGFKAINTAAKSTKVSFNAVNNQINIGTLNFATLTNMLQKVKAALDKIVNLFKRVTHAASEWEGISNRFGRGFGPGAQEVYEWIQKCNEAMGMNVQQFMQYTSIYATMLTGFGVATADASKMALGYAELTYDVWAGYNDIYKTYEEAADAVKSAIAGEVEPIRKAGFTVIESTLEQTAANHGLKVSLANATEAQKSYLRYLTLVDQAHAQSLVGTYAKELSTAEGLTRTLSMQVKSLAQTFGSLFLPVLTKIVPYLQAFLEILIDCVQYLGALFGITIQEVDWSGYNAGVSSAVESTEDLEKAVQEVKNATLGIDELNVISPQSASGATDGSATTPGFDGLDVDSLWDESILDSVNSQVVEIRNELKGVETALKNTLGWLVEHKDTLLMIGAIFLGWKLISSIKKVGKALGGLKLVETAKTLFKTVKTTGGSSFTALKNTVSGVGTSLTGITKATTVALAGILEFVTIKDSVAALATGCENVGGEIVTIGVAATGAAAAMYVALGPWGIALAAVVGLAGAVAGLYEANEQLILQYVNTTIFDDTGYKISDLAGFMQTLWSETSEANTRIETLVRKIEENNTILTESQAGFEAYQGYLNTTGTLTKTQAEEMSKYVSNFKTALQQNLEFDTKLIFEEFNKLSKDAAKNLGLDVDDMTNALLGFQSTFNEETNKLERTAQGYFDKIMAGDVLKDEEVDDLEETLGKLTLLSDQTYENQKKVKDAMANLGDLNLEDTETAMQAIKDITQLGTEMHASADAAYKEANDSIDKLEWQAKQLFDNGMMEQEAYDQFGDVLENYRLGITEAYNAEKEQINTDLGTVFGYIDAQVQQAGLDVYEGAGEEWKNLDWFQKLFNPNEEDYALKTYEKAKDEVLDPIFDALTGAAEGFGLNFESGKSITDDFYDGIYDVRHMPVEDNPFYDEAVNAVDGYKKGIEDNLDDATAAFRMMAERGLGAVVETQDSHSPAVEYIELAKDAVDGYALGVEQNIGSVETVWKKGLENVAQIVSETMDTIVKNATNVFSTDTWAGYARNVTNALSKIKMPTLGGVELKVSYNTDVSAEKKKIYEALDLPGWPKLKFAASGGVFNTGSLIWAGERGPEVMATAAGGKTGVMNVQQMQDAVYEGVYAAVSAAMGSGNNGNQQVVVYLDGKQLTSTVEKRQHERGATLMGSQVYGY